MIHLTLPKDVREFILEVQMQKKVEKGIGSFSQQHTIIFILREMMLVKGFHTKKERDDANQETG